LIRVKYPKSWVFSASKEVSVITARATTPVAESGRAGAGILVSGTVLLASASAGLAAASWPADGTEARRIPRGLHS
jgi:hypothetical protein